MAPWGKSIPARGNSQGKGRAPGACLAWWRNGEEAGGWRGVRQGEVVADELREEMGARW